MVNAFIRWATTSESTELYNQELNNKSSIAAILGEETETNTSPPSEHLTNTAAHAVLNASDKSDHSPIRGKSNLQRSIVRIPELDQAKDLAKKLEWKLSLQAMINGFDLAVESISQFTLKTSLPSRSPNDFLQLRILRMLKSIQSLKNDRTVKPKASDLIQETKKLAALLQNDVRRLTVESIASHIAPYFLACNLADNTFLLDQYASELFIELSSCFYHVDSFENAYANLRKDVLTLVDLLDGSKSHLDTDPKSRAKAILMILRFALHQPAYSLMCCDETDPMISFLHSIVVSSFAHSETLPAYIQLGRPIRQKAESIIKRIDSLGDILISSRNVAANAGFPEDDPLVNDRYVSKAAVRILPEHMAITISKITDIISVGANFICARISPFLTLHAIVNHIQAYFLDTSKDYIGFYDNLDCALYEENFTGLHNAAVSLRVIIGSSPAQGSKVHPEFSALLQAMENGGALGYKKLIYTNLQKRFEGSEGLQTDALMHLNERYPFSFEAITLGTDPLPKCDTFDASIKNKMLTTLLSEQSFTLKDLSVKSNYYFPAKSKATLKHVFSFIVNKAFDLVNKQDEIEPSRKVGIFCDFVHLGIIRHREAVLVATYMRNGGHEKLLSSRNCAACTDRGMMVNSEFMHLLDNKPEATAEIDIGRSILAKKRLILENRAKQIGIFAHNSRLNVNKQKFLNDIDDHASGIVRIKSKGITHPGCPESLFPEKRVISVKRKLRF